MEGEVHTVPESWREIKHKGNPLVSWDYAVPNSRLHARMKHLRASCDTCVYPGGTRPTDQAFDDAERFVASLPELRIYPTVGLVADGEINFLWKEGGVHVDLGFMPMERVPTTQGTSKEPSFFATAFRSRTDYRLN